VNDAALSVTGGTFTNSAGSTVHSLPGTGGGRTVTLGANVDFINQGTLTVDADLRIFTGGGTSSFDTSGSVAIAPGAAFRPRAEFNYLAGTIGGGGTLDLSLVTASLTPNLTMGPSLTVGFDATTVNGPGTLVVAAGATLYAGTGGGMVNAPFVNNGTFEVRGNTTLAGAVTTAAGSAIRVIGNASVANVSLTVSGAGGLTNNGLIELTSEDGVNDAALSVTGGTFTNSAGSTVHSLPGTGGGRRIDVDNNADFVNQGALTVDADLSVFAGGDSVVTNSGTFSVAAAQTLTLNGTFTNLANNTLTGGIYDVAGTFRTTGGINALAADLRLNGAASAVINNTNSTNALSGFNTVFSSGSFLDGINFTATGAFTNSGTVFLKAGTTFTAAGGFTNAAGATLGGNGTVAAFVSSPGTVSPGFSPGNITVGGGITLGGPLVIELTGPTAGTQYDRLTVNGPVTLGGPLTLSASFAAAAGTQFRVIDNVGTDAVVGTFSGLPQGGTVTVNGQEFTIDYAGGTGNDVVLTRTASPLAPPRVAGVQVNDGSAQRSRVTSLQVTFSTAVAFAGGSVGAAFTLARPSDGTAVSFTAAATVVNGVTVVTLDAFTGAATEFGSLADGRYTLTALAGQISFGGQQLDGNGDGIGGDDYTFGGAQGLFRYYGDVNGDGVVNGADFALFRTAFGTTAGNPAYLWYLDYNGDGAVNGLDFAQFRSRFGTALP
jgi:hypothetical protein